LEGCLVITMMEMMETVTLPIIQKILSMT
jgi:hypothetical protein